MLKPLNPASYIKHFRKYDYSAPVTLLEDEEYDFDTVHENPTGINDDRATLPRRYEIEENLSNLEDDFDWQITYKFTSGHRPYLYNGHVYGGRNVTYRRLYLILCERLNGGEYFIDTYFKECYPDRLKDYVDKELETTKSALLAVADEYLKDLKITKRGQLDRRATKRNAGAVDKLREYERTASLWEDERGEYIARLIKDDIMNCLETGIIPLQKGYNTPETMERRRRAGLNDSPSALFYASSNLINNLHLYIRIGGTGKWQTTSGIMV